MIGIKILLEAGECNGFFDMAVQDHLGNILSDPKLHSGTNTVEFRCSLPNTLRFVLSGKDNRRDTVVDPIHGSIIQDKFVNVLDFYVDNKPLNVNKTKKLFTLHTEDDVKIRSSYWGFNGTVDLDMPYKNSFEFHLSNLV